MTFQKLKRSFGRIYILVEMDRGKFTRYANAMMELTLRFVKRDFHGTGSIMPAKLCARPD